MPADRGRRDADPHGQRARRQRRPAEQLLEHPRAGAVGERGGDVGEIGHGIQATPGTFRRAPKRPGPTVGRCSRLPVPSPGPAGPYGTLAWLRATVSRFANGDTHARRRALIEARLAALPPDDLRAAAAAATAARLRAAASPDVVAAPATPAALADAPYVPVAVLAAATGVAPRDVAEVVELVRVVAAAYHPGTDAPGADAALARLLALLPPAEPETAAQHVALLVQACEATAALVRGALERPLEDVLRDHPPVRATKRLDPDGRLVVVDLGGRPFGAGPRACPGEAHARALVAGVVEATR